MVIDPTITAQFQKNVAITNLRYSGSNVLKDAVSDLIGEKRIDINVSPIGKTAYYSFVDVDDFSLTGSSSLKFTVMFYGIK